MYTRQLKNKSLRPLRFTKLREKPLRFPNILIKRLAVEAVLLCVMGVTGTVMESMQEGQGYLKLTVLCAACLGCHLIYMIWIIVAQKYDIKEGEVIEIRIPKYGKKYREIYIKDSMGNIEGLAMEGQYGIKRGQCYRFYVNSGKFIDAEELS